APSLPISVKTRIGYSKKAEMENWVRELLSEDIAALIVHLRTRKEMSKVPAHWELMEQIVKIRDEMKKGTLIIGNGDVADIDDARRKCEETGCDGVMLGKAIFGNPWLFDPSRNLPFAGEEEIRDKLKVMIEHTKLFEQMLGKYKNFAIMKKHYKAYVEGFAGAKELRMKLMEAKNATEVEKITNDFLTRRR
ncbi:tRNA-dihydrouridine synthase, partial [Candidatus Uhrbacteria bacterium]|nr:tRNA-dihydrouridine synthase [Candidatus Uhrbacteria bacterium]